jgi:hypothetical protein
MGSGTVEASQPPSDFEKQRKKNINIEKRRQYANISYITCTLLQV